MTNITLSIEETVYTKMKKHSEIKWSEFIRKKIKERLDVLEFVDSSKNQESILTMLASEGVLKKEWENSYDERWDNV